jgi:hypothetical protein
MRGLRASQPSYRRGEGREVKPHRAAPRLGSEAAAQTGLLGISSEKVAASTPLAHRSIEGRRPRMRYARELFRLTTFGVDEHGA